MKSLKQKLVVASVTFAVVRLMAQSAWEPTFAGAWSVSVEDPTNRLSLSARLVVSVEAGNSGSQTALAYVELRNTNLMANPLYVYHESEDVPQLSCQLRDAKGKEVAGSGIELWGDMLPGFWLVLPYDSTIRFRPFPRESKAPNGEKDIFGGLNLWRLPPGDTNDYYLSGKLTLIAPKAFPPPAFPDIYLTNSFGVRKLTPTPTFPWQGTLQLPPVKISAVKQ